MKPIILICFLFLTRISFGQIIFIDTFDLKGHFKEQVTNGMKKYHNKYRTNYFYNFNFDKKTVTANDDSIIYRLKLITKIYGSVLWGAKGKFSKIDNKLVCEISELIMLKKSSLGKGVDYINVSADEMEDTKGNRMNLAAIREEVKKFFKIFSK